jgi:hypothetical protein
MRNSTILSEDIQIELECQDVDLECQDVDNWAHETNSARGVQKHDIADGVDLPLTTILEMFPETVEPIGEDQKRLYHELALNIQHLLASRLSPFTISSGNQQRYSSSKLNSSNINSNINMLSTYAPEPRPALVHDEWMTTMRGHDKIIPSMDMELQTCFWIRLWRLRDASSCGLPFLIEV